MVFRCTFVGCCSTPLCSSCSKQSTYIQSWVVVRPLCEPSISSSSSQYYSGWEGPRFAYIAHARGSKTRGWVAEKFGTHGQQKLRHKSLLHIQCFSLVRVNLLRTNPQKCHGMDSKIGAHVIPIISSKNLLLLLLLFFQFIILLLLLWFVWYNFRQS